MGQNSGQLITALAGAAFVAAGIYFLSPDLVLIGATLLLGAALAPEGLANEARDQATLTRNPAQPHRVLYGERLVSGSISFMETAPRSGKEHKFIQIYMAMMNHKCLGVGNLHLPVPSWAVGADELNFEELLLNDNVIPWHFFDRPNIEVGVQRFVDLHPAAIVLSGFYKMTDGGNEPGPKIWVKAQVRLGSDSQQALIFSFNKKSSSFTPELWTSAHRMLRTCYGFVQLRFKQNRFPAGLPNVRWLLRGKCVWDPRRDDLEGTVVLLTHLEESTPLDLSDSAHTLTPAGAAAVDTAVKKFGIASFDMGAGGSGDRISVAVSRDFDFGLAPFTLECFANWHNAPSGTEETLLSFWRVAGNRKIWKLSWNAAGSGVIRFTITDNGITELDFDTDTFNPTPGTWYHIAVDRDINSELRIYIGGVVRKQANISQFELMPTTTIPPMTIGDHDTGGEPMDGNIDDVRIIKGRA